MTRASTAATGKCPTKSTATKYRQSGLPPNCKTKQAKNAVARTVKPPITKPVNQRGRGRENQVLRLTCVKTIHAPSEGNVMTQQFTPKVVIPPWLKSMA